MLFVWSDGCVRHGQARGQAGGVAALSRRGLAWPGLAGSFPPVSVISVSASLARFLPVHDRRTAAAEYLCGRKTLHIHPNAIQGT